MCFICRVLTGEEALTESQAPHLYPAALALHAAACDAMGSRPDAVEALATLAKMRGSPDALEVYRTVQAYKDFRETLCNFNRPGIGPHVSRSYLTHDLFSVPGESADLPEDERIELAELREDLSAIAGRLASLNADGIRKIYNRERSPRARAIVQALSDAKSILRSALA